MRTCIGCKVEKQDKAFIGQRDHCRICWHYLPEDVKEVEKMHSANVSIKLAEYRYWKDKPPRPGYPKRKSLKLNVKVLD